jgi:antagonist of KipI
VSATLTVLAPGLLTTVQDAGRWGHQSIGVPVAGPMDPFAHRLANALVGNARGAATLEVTLAGPQLRFDAARAFAVTGADFDLRLDGEPVPRTCAGLAAAGAVLAFGERRAGARGYVAVAGGLDVPPVLGSRATHLPTAMGGWQGRALRRGDVLPLGEPSHAAVRSEPHPQRGFATRGDRPIVIRVLPGPHVDRFDRDALRALTSAPYRVGVDSNRMAFRLEGAALAHRTSADIISDATPVGTVQVPGSGQPMLLMADRQTTGGYAQLATVISADIGLAGQAAPGDRLQFVLCTHAEALSALVEREGPLLALEGAA